jgi:hypothetical protein
MLSSKQFVQRSKPYTHFMQNGLGSQVQALERENARHDETNCLNSLGVIFHVLMEVGEHEELAPNGPRALLPRRPSPVLVMASPASRAAHDPFITLVSFSQGQIQLLIGNII